MLKTVTGLLLLFQSFTLWSQKLTDNSNAELLHRAQKALTRVIVHDIFSPPVAGIIYLISLFIKLCLFLFTKCRRANRLTLCCRIQCDRSHFIPIRFYCRHISRRCWQPFTIRFNIAVPFDLPRFFIIVPCSPFAYTVYNGICKSY